MSDPNGPDAAEIPPSTPHVGVTRRSRWSAGLIWLVPAIAALVGVGMVIHSWYSEGPAIEISFATAEGLEAGKTQVKYKDVVIGLVDSIRLVPDRSHIVTHVKLDKSAASFAADDSRFWVVRPRFGTTGISGIGTLLSGAYIGADVGTSRKSRKEFLGMETPPALIHGEAGKQFILRAKEIGSLGTGSPVYYHHVQVGRVVANDLDNDGKQMRVEIFISAPYDRFVTASSRFWNASGVDLTLDASGFRFNTQSLATVVAGGIAFGTPPGPSDANPAAENAEFTLFDDLQTAMAPPDGEPIYLRMRFEQSLRGLALGAPLDLRGTSVGKVVSIDLDYDAEHQSFPSIVGALIYPQRLGRVHERVVELRPNDGPEERLAHIVKPLIARGFRAQARTGSLLTGQLYIELDFIKDAPTVVFDEEQRPIELPTAGGSFDKVQEQMASIVGRIDRIPFEAIGKNLDKAIVQLDRTLQHVDGAVLPQLGSALSGAQGATGDLRKMLANDAPLQQSLKQTLEQLQQMARSLRILTDDLDQRPQMLIRGIPADPPPANAKKSLENKP